MVVLSALSSTFLKDQLNSALEMQKNEQEIEALLSTINQNPAAAEEIVQAQDYSQENSEQNEASSPEDSEENAGNNAEETDTNANQAETGVEETTPEDEGPKGFYQELYGD